MKNRSICILSSFILLICMMLISGCDKGDTKTSIGSFDFVIENVKLFDGENVIENASVFVNGSKVERIIINNDDAFEASTLIDGVGKTLIPGLIDAHVHVENEGALSEAALSGVLTLLDAFNFDPDNAEQLRQAGNETPDLSYFYSAGIGVTIEGGILSSIPGLETVSDVSEILQFIQKRVDEGSDYIKIMIDPNKSRNQPVLTDEMIQACINEAHGHELKCIAHAGRISDALKAAEYGAEGITHIWFRDEVPATSAALGELKSSGVFVIPTANYIEKGHEDGYVAMSPSVMKTELINIYTAGIPIVAGTDAFDNRYGIGYGSGLISELELYAEVGIPELEVLRSATMNASIYFDLGSKGFIKENMPADFFLVDGDPTSNISALRNVESVWKQGVQIVP